MNQSPSPVAAVISSSSRLWESSEEAHAAFMSSRVAEAAPEASQCVEERAAEVAHPFVEKGEAVPIYSEETKAPGTSAIEEGAAVATESAKEASTLSKRVEATAVCLDPTSFRVESNAAATTQQQQVEQQISAALGVASPAAAGFPCHSIATLPAAVHYNRSSLLVDSAAPESEDSSSKVPYSGAAGRSSLSNITAAYQRESTSRSISNCRTDAEDNHSSSVVLRAATEKPVSETAAKETEEQAVSAAAAAAAANQPTPFGLNRYVLLFLHVLYVIATARVLFGWPHLSSMLFRSEAFAWLCAPENISYPKDVWMGNLRAAAAVAGTRYLCAAQDNAVQLLFTVGIAIAFCCSLLSGLLLDWRGPRLCASIGQLLNTTGWLLFAFSSETCQTYIPAVICLALGADAGYLPSFAVSKLFPGHEPLIVVTLAAAMSASFSIPTLMDVSWRSNLQSLSFQKVCLFYASFGTGICAMVAIFLFPKKGYKSDEDFRKSMQLQMQPQMQQQPQVQQQGDETEKQQLLQAKEQQHDRSSLSVQKGKEECLQVHVDSYPLEDTTTGTAATTEAPPGATGDAKLSLRQQLRSQYFIFFVVYWPLNALFYNFYMTSAEHLFNVAVNELLGILGPLSMIPSLVLGKVADIWGVQTLVLVIALAGAAMYFFTLFPGQIVCYYISAVLSCLYVSNFSGQMYAFVSDTFSPADFGKVVGIISASGGLLALLRIPLAEHLTLTVFDGNYTSTCYIMFAVTLFCLLLAIRLFCLKRKQPKAYLSFACPEEQVATAENTATERQHLHQQQNELCCRSSSNMLLQQQQLISKKDKGDSSSSNRSSSRIAQP